MSPLGSGAIAARPRKLTQALGVALVAISLSGLAACTSHTSGSGSHPTLPTSPSTTPTTPVPTTPSTSEETTPSLTPTASSVTSPVQQQTNLIITRSGWDAATHTASAVAILPGQVIQTGSCTLTLRQGSATRSVSKSSTPDASSTDCGLLAITGPLAAGTWLGTVTFTGGGVTATSGTITYGVTS